MKLELGTHKVIKTAFLRKMELYDFALIPSNGHDIDKVRSTWTSAIHTVKQEGENYFMLRKIWQTGHILVMRVF